MNSTFLKPHTLLTTYFTGPNCKLKNKTNLISRIFPNNQKLLFYEQIYTDGSKGGEAGSAVINRNKEYFKRLLNGSSVYSEEITVVNVALDVIVKTKSC